MGYKSDIEIAQETTMSLTDDERVFYHKFGVSVIKSTGYRKNK